MSNYYSILLTLADGAWHDFRELETVSEANRSPLVALLRQLEADGLVFEGLGTRRLRWLNPSEPLSGEKILEGLSPQVNQMVSALEVHYELESTNRYLGGSEFASGKVCLAEKQRAGRGRLGRHWHSPPCANIYLSLEWRFEAKPAQLTGLSLGVGIQLAKALRLYAQVGLKWPNDLYIDNQKLGGVLVELKPLSTGGTGAVIGIGINIFMDDAVAEIDQPWTSLYWQAQRGEDIERNGLISRILEGLLPFLDQFLHQGDEAILRYWSEYDLAYQRAVTVHSGGESVVGTGAGIDHQFRFLLQHNQGISSFSSADVSLRL
jgi:BirA family biotin operon repressor/biotin-[acetyl-CoA-carboxylase] ligase